MPLPWLAGVQSFAAGLASHAEVASVVGTGALAASLPLGVVALREESGRVRAFAPWATGLSAAAVLASWLVLETPHLVGRWV